MQVQQILVEGEGEAARAVGVRLTDGRVFRGKAVVSNATRWDTFERLLAAEEMPEPERLFRWGLSSHCFSPVHLRYSAPPKPSLSCNTAFDGASCVCLCVWFA